MHTPLPRAPTPWRSQDTLLTAAAVLGEGVHTGPSRAGVRSGATGRELRSRLQHGVQEVGGVHRASKARLDTCSVRAPVLLVRPPVSHGGHASISLQVSARQKELTQELGCQGTLLKQRWGVHRGPKRQVRPRSFEMVTSILHCPLFLFSCPTGLLRTSARYASQVCWWTVLRPGLLTADVPVSPLFRRTHPESRSETVRDLPGCTELGPASGKTHSRPGRVEPGARATELAGVTRVGAAGLLDGGVEAAVPDDTPGQLDTCTALSPAVKSSGGVELRVYSTRHRSWVQEGLRLPGVVLWGQRMGTWRGLQGQPWFSEPIRCQEASQLFQSPAPPNLGSHSHPGLSIGPVWPLGRPSGCPCGAWLHGPRPGPGLGLSPGCLCCSSKQRLRSSGRSPLNPRFQTRSRSLEDVRHVPSRFTRAVSAERGDPGP